MSKNVEAKHPAADRKTDQQENNDRPNEKVTTFLNSWIVRAKGELGAPRAGVGGLSFAFSRHGDLVQERALPAGSNDVPQPQLRALKGFLTRKPAPDKPSS